MLLIKDGQDLDVARRWIGNSGVAEEIIGFYDQKETTDFDEGACYPQWRYDILDCQLNIR